MPVVFFKRYRMQFDLRDAQFSDSVLPEGYELLPWCPELLNAHAEAKYRSFRNELDANVFPCLGAADCASVDPLVLPRGGGVTAAPAAKSPVAPDMVRRCSPVDRTSSARQSLGRSSVPPQIAGDNCNLISFRLRVILSSSHCLGNKHVSDQISR